MLCGIICYAFTWTECFFVSDKEYTVYKLVLHLQITKCCPCCCDIYSEYQKRNLFLLGYLHIDTAKQFLLISC